MSARAAVPRLGLAAPWGGATLRELAADVVAIAADGLRGRSRRNDKGADETIYLEPLRVIVDGGPTQAEEWLAQYNGEWGGDIRLLWSKAAI